MSMNAQIQQQTLRCQKAGCGREVVYEPQPVFGGLAGSAPKSHRPKERIQIYLDCTAGHTYPYVIWPYVRKN